MLSQELVSLVVPMHNCKAYLDDFLASVAKQSYENWELVVVEDHSTDGTLAALRELIQKDHRLRDKSNIYVNAQKGVSAARNEGIRRERAHGSRS
jgi:teichuronic acid biosynthesis glycosyltransferase TuaG